MFHKEYKLDHIVIVICFLVVALFMAGVLWFADFDHSVLTPHFESFSIVDKWHEEDCSSVQDSNGNYIGESCEDLWKLVITNRKLDNLDFGSQRFEKSVKGSIFKEFRMGERVSRQYDSGRLGIIHNEIYQRIGDAYASFN